MPISARKRQRRIYGGGLKKSGILNEQRNLNCKGIRVCWAGGTGIESERKGTRLKL